MTKERYYIDAEGNDDSAYLKAIKFACELANKKTDITKVILLIATKNNAGWFERIYGQKISKQLFKGVKFKDCNPEFKYETRITFSEYYSPADIVIACGLDDKDLLKIDDNHNIKVIIAIPWLRVKLEKWLKTWNPTEISGKTSSIPVYPEPTCIVKKAMEELTETINMRTGITHPSDEMRAKTYILALHKYEPSLNSNIVGAFLKNSLNWETENVKDIENLIIKLNSGKYFQGGERTGLQHHYKRWKDECLKST